MSSLTSMAYTPQGKSNTNHSTSSNSQIEIRYNKSIREISKLININNTLKKQADDFKNLYHKLQYDCNYMREDFSRILHDKNIMQDRIEQLQTQNRNYRNQIYSKDTKQVQQIKFDNQQLKEIIQHKNREVMQLREKLENQGQSIIKLEDILGVRNVQNQELNTKIKELQEKLQDNSHSQVVQKKNKMKEQQDSIFCIKCGKLQKQINTMKQWTHKTEEQNVHLRKQLISQLNKIQNIDNTSIRTNFNMPGTRSSRSQFSLIESLEHRNREISTQKKQQELKSNKMFKLLQKQNYRLKKQIQKISQRNQRLEDFLMKQKAFLESQVREISGPTSLEKRSTIYQNQRSRVKQGKNSSLRQRD